jgi:bud site selection protein 31
MPKVRHARSKKPPQGFDDIEPTLQEFAQRMKDAENEPHEGKRRVESLWPIFRLHHQRSRYIYELYYKREAITKEVYEYCLKQGYGDANLIAKWKKPGFERLCCLRCIQPKDTNFGTTCICRVPKSRLEEGRIVECVLCGCRGCASTDFISSKKEPRAKQKQGEEGSSSSYAQSSDQAQAGAVIEAAPVHAMPTVDAPSYDVHASSEDRRSGQAEERSGGGKDHDDDDDDEERGSSDDE